MSRPGQRVDTIKREMFSQKSVRRFVGDSSAFVMGAALSQSEEISSDFCCFYGDGIRHNEDIMHSFQNFIVRLIPSHPPPLETRIWKLVVRALHGRHVLSQCPKQRHSPPGNIKKCLLIPGGNASV